MPWVLGKKLRAPPVKEAEAVLPRALGLGKHLKVPQALLQHRRKQLFLAAEVMEQQALGNARHAADAVGGGFSVSPPAEFPQGGV